ncbi:MAG: hypothetical protein QOC64_621, partial [Solirubrobacteraceae bacterium]|nr:hypothetical protein [Solirubrobacteraceae bacterium]
MVPGRGELGLGARDDLRCGGGSVERAHADRGRERSAGGARDAAHGAADVVRHRRRLLRPGVHHDRREPSRAVRHEHVRPAQAAADRRRHGRRRRDGRLAVLRVGELDEQQGRLPAVVRAPRELRAEDPLEERRARGGRLAVDRRLLHAHHELAQLAVLTDRRDVQAGAQDAGVRGHEPALQAHDVVRARGREPLIAAPELARVAEVVEREPRHGVRREPEEPRERGVDLEQAPLRRGERHPARRLLEDGAEAGVGLRAGGLRAAAADDGAEADQERLGEREDRVVVRRAADQVRRLGRVGGEHDDGHAVQRGDAQRVELRFAPGAPDVDHDGVERHRGGGRRRLVRGRRAPDVVVLAEQLLEVAAERRPLLDEQHGRQVVGGRPPPAAGAHLLCAQVQPQRLDRRAPVLGHVELGPVLGRRGRRLVVELDGEQRAALRSVAHADRAAQQRHEVAHDRQAQAGPARPAVRGAGHLAIALEDGLAVPGRDAGARVRDLDAHPAVAGLERAADDPTRRRVAHRVGHEVREDGEQLGVVGPRGQAPGRAQDQALVALLQEAREARRGPVDQPRDVAVDRVGGHPPGVHPRGLQQVVGVLEQPVGAGADPFQVALLGGGAVRGREQAAGEPEDDRQRRLELVARVGDEVAAPRLRLAHVLHEAAKLGMVV